MYYLFLLYIILFSAARVKKLHLLLLHLKYWKVFAKFLDATSIYAAFILTKILSGEIINVYIPFETGGIINGKGTC